MHTRGEVTGVTVTECLVVERAIEDLHGPPDRDFSGIGDERIATSSASGAHQQIGLSQYPQQLGGVLDAETLGLGNRADRDGRAIIRSG